MRVWITRDEEPGGPMAVALKDHRLTPVLEPVIARRLLTDAAAALRALGPDDWLVLTSVFAIESVAAGPARVPHVAVVGDQTRRAAVARGFRVDLVAAGQTRDSLLADLKAKVTQGRVCYPRSSEAPPPKPWAKVQLISPVLYETAPRSFDRSVITRVDVASLASPSAVRAIGRVDLPFASIGPSTSKALRELGIEPWVESPDRSFAALAAAIAEKAARR